MQFLADITGAPVDRPKVLETTALGVAWLAGMKRGAMPGQEEFAKQWVLERQFEPSMAIEDRARKYADWRRAVSCTLEY
jgi:glycerol kinase